MSQPDCGQGDVPTRTGSALLNGEKKKPEKKFHGVELINNTAVNCVSFEHTNPFLLDLTKDVTALVYNS